VITDVNLELGNFHLTHSFLGKGREVDPGGKTREIISIFLGCLAVQSTTTTPMDGRWAWGVVGRRFPRCGP
jgi:hypothetical protein